jgi:hypothetical protein
MKKQFITEAQRLQKLAGIINENQSRELDSIPLNPEIKDYIDGVIQDAKDSDEFDYLLDVGFFGTDLADNILTNFGDDYPNAYMLSKQVEDYIDSQL